MTDEDEDFFSAEADGHMTAPTSDEELTIPTNDPPLYTCGKDETQDQSGASSEQTSITSVDLSDGYKARANPKEAEDMHASGLHSRDTKFLSPKQMIDQKKIQMKTGEAN